MKKQQEWASLQHIPNKEYIVGSALIMQALICAIDEIRTISLLLPLSTMSQRQLRRHFLREAGKKMESMSEEQFAEFISKHFNSDDFENKEDKNNA